VPVPRSWSTRSLIGVGTLVALSVFTTGLVVAQPRQSDLERQHTPATGGLIPEELRPRRGLVLTPLPRTNVSAEEHEPRGAKDNAPAARQDNTQASSRTGQGNRWVALTFDDGPNPRFTPQVLQLLRRYHAKAVFCVIGREVQRYPDVVRAIVADGHRLCNHTMAHDQRLRHKPPAAIRADMRQVNAAIHRSVPRMRVSYFRAPAGNWSSGLRHIAEQAGMQPLGWTVDTRDWADPGVQTIVATTRKQLRPGGVVLLHDGGGDQSQTIQALGQLLPTLAKQGYRFGFPIA